MHVTGFKIFSLQKKLNLNNFLKFNWIKFSRDWGKLNTEVVQLTQNHWVS